MANLRRIIPFVTLILIVVLTTFCIVGAFLGAQRAGELANSIPATIFWIILTILLIVGLFTFEKLIYNPGLLAAHLGAILILIGSMAGSEKGNRILDKLFGTETIRSSYMIIPEGRSSNVVLDAAMEKTIGHLPFSVHLRRFWIEYYPAGGSDLIPKDYKSALSIITDRQEVADKVIEVNDPLHYGGYHFYQDSYILDQVNCTILSVHSDRGLALVYLGFALLCAGAAWLFYVQWPIEAIRRRKHDNP